MQQVKQVQVKITSGTALSSVGLVSWEQLVGILMPAGWDAADITFQNSLDGTTFGDVFTVSGEYKIPSAQVAVGRTLILSPLDTNPLFQIKVRSGITSAPVNQTADRIITLLIKAIE